MRKTKTQKDYHKQMKSLQQSSNLKGSNRKFNLFQNTFTQSKFFYYGIRIILLLVILTLAGNIDALLYSFFQ